MFYNQKYNEMLLSLRQGREGTAGETADAAQSLYIYRQLGRGYSNFGNNHFCDRDTLHHYIYITIIIIIIMSCRQIPTKTKTHHGGNHHYHCHHHIDTNQLSIGRPLLRDLLLNTLKEPVSIISTIIIKP